MKVRLGAGLSALQKKIGGFCGKVINGRQQLSRLSSPYAVSGGESSAAQDAQRAWYAAKVEEWRTASPAEREAWDLLGAPLNISGFNLLVSIMAVDQTDVNPDAVEATTLDSPIVSLLSNMNRIRHWIVALSGEAWGTVSHSIADIWAKFHATTGHKHTAVAGDGPQLDHGRLGGLIDDDHIQYFDKNGSKAMTGRAILRSSDDSFMGIHGGPDINSSPALMLVGKNIVHRQAGGLIVMVTNAAKTGLVAVLRVNGNTDTPYLDWQAWQMSNIKNPVNAQDAATKKWVEDHFRPL